MVMRRILAPVNTVVYGSVDMSDQLSAKDWVDQGLKALAGRGFGWKALGAVVVLAVAGY